MKRFSVGLAAAAVAALALTACSGGSGTAAATTPAGASGASSSDAVTGPASEAPLEPQTIRMWTFLDPTAQGGRQAALKQIIEKFETDNPGVKVSVEPQQFDLLASKFFAASAAGNAPDISWVSQPDLGQAIKLGVFEPFENMFLKNWTADQVADIDGPYFEAGATADAHYQVTLSQNYMGVIYRKDLFTAKGLSLPKTWDELVADAQALTGTDEVTGIQRYGFGMGLALDKADPNIAAAALLDEQGSLFNDDGTANWANDAGKKAFQLELDMVQKYKVTPQSAVTATVEDMYNDFLAGKYAIINGASTRVATLQASATFGAENIGFMPYPTFSGDTAPVGYLNGWSVGVWSGSDHKDAAGRFIEALVSPEADALWVTSGGQIPVLKSTLKSQSDFLNQPNEQFLTDAANGIVSEGWAQPTEFPASGWFADFNQVAQDVLANGKSLDDALAAAEKAFNDRNAG